MITQQFTIKNLDQSIATGTPLAAVTLTPVVDPATQQSTSPALVSFGIVDRPQDIRASGIPVDQIAGLTLGQTVTLTITGQ